MLCCLFVLVRLSVPVQVIDWKDLSLKWPIMCWWGVGTLSPTQYSLTHSLTHNKYQHEECSVYRLLCSLPLSDIPVWMTLQNIAYCALSLSLSLSLSLRFNSHFPVGEPGLAGVYWSKWWWRWWRQLDYWRYKSCKAPVKSSAPTNQHPVFLQAEVLKYCIDSVDRRCVIFWFLHFVVGFLWQVCGELNR